MCVCVCVRACMCAFVRACVRASVRACVCVRGLVENIGTKIVMINFEKIGVSLFFCELPI